MVEEAVAGALAGAAADAMAHRIKAYTDIEVEYVRALLKEVIGSRRVVVQLLNATKYNLELMDQVVVHGKTTQGVSRTTVKPGETVTWKGCKGTMALYGTLIYTTFSIKGTGTIVFLGNENPYAGAA